MEEKERMRILSILPSRKKRLDFLSVCLNRRMK
jgi:hypothetical protein